MLHLNTIDDTVNDLLTKLTSSDYLNQFALAGGTSLALQMGHRKSIDIDLFSIEDVNMNEISLLLENDFEKITIRRTTPAFIFCFIQEGIRLYSIEDIAAMKLNAICGRGSKKDFYDIYSLLQLYSLKELMHFYDTKFQSDNSWMALRSMQYFEDADTQEEPELIKSFPEWTKIKQFLIEKVNDF